MHFPAASDESGGLSDTAAQALIAAGVVGAGLVAAAPVAAPGIAGIIPAGLGGFGLEATAASLALSVGSITAAQLVPAGLQALQVFAPSTGQAIPALSVIFAEGKKVIYLTRVRKYESKHERLKMLFHDLSL